MKNISDDMTFAFNHGISGFHIIQLSDPVHISFVSDNLCQMTGWERDSLLSETEDLYAKRVHPEDRLLYASFLQKLKAGEQKQCEQYRLICQDGSTLFVRDSITVQRQSDGSLAGISVLVDITEMEKERELHMLDEKLACGFLKYTCEKQPKITYMNRQMMRFLRIPEVQTGEMDYQEMYRDNLFLMIPMEDRHKFALYLNRVYSAGTPIAGDLTLLRCDGTRAHMFGWVTKCTNDQGEEEFLSVCMDVTQRYEENKVQEEKKYLKALTDVYDKIFEYDLSSNTVKCLYSNHSAMFQWTENIAMQMEDATEKWIAQLVVPRDIEKVRTFFYDFCQKRLYQPDGKPPQIRYRAYSSSGEIRTYNGIFLKMEESVSLFCCRRIADAAENKSLREELGSLKENMQQLLRRFTDGVAAFEITDDMVKPLYASDNICRFFGYTKEEWMPLMKQKTPIPNFIAKSSLTQTQIMDILHNGEAEFTYKDLETKQERKIKAICSQKGSGGVGARYVMLYNMEENQRREQPEPEGKKVSIRTFGYFDVFVGDKPIAFRNKKAKELFAILVDRRGGFVTSAEAIAYLWEDEVVTPVTLSRYRKVALRLKNTLEEYGIGDVVETIDGTRRIVMEKVKCDLYDYLTGKEAYAQLFKGSYLTNYSWGENTLAELTGNMLYE